MNILLENFIYLLVLNNGNRFYIKNFVEELLKI